MNHHVSWEELKASMTPSPGPIPEPPPSAPDPPLNQPAMVVLRSGDHVLLAMHEDPAPDEAQAWVHSLHQAFRGVSFTLVGGVAGIAVQAGEPKR